MAVVVRWSGLLGMARPEAQDPSVMLAMLFGIEGAEVLAFVEDESPSPPLYLISKEAVGFHGPTVLPRGPPAALPRCHPLGPGTIVDQTSEWIERRWSMAKCPVTATKSGMARRSVGSAEQTSTVHCENGHPNVAGSHFCESCGSTINGSSDSVPSVQSSDTNLVGDPALSSTVQERHAAVLQCPCQRNRSRVMRRLQLSTSVTTEARHRASQEDRPDARDRPSYIPTIIVVTLLLGFFGLIPAIRHSRMASDRGFKTAGYGW